MMQQHLKAVLLLEKSGLPRNLANLVCPVDSSNFLSVQLLRDDLDGTSGAGLPQACIVKYAQRVDGVSFIFGKSQFPT